MARLGIFKAMALLTRREQTLVAFVLIAFGLGLGIKHWREMKPASETLAAQPASR